MNSKNRYPDPRNASIRTDSGHRDNTGNNRNGYKVTAPWAQQSDDLVDTFEQGLDNLDAKVVPPWEDTSTDLYKLEEQRRLASTYKFQSMFEVPPLPPQKVQQLENYKINPPFNCGYNQTAEALKASKKLNPEMKNPRTREPWSYGSLPAETFHKKLYPQNTTTLWDAPRGDSSTPKEALESSGDPILDELRKQLLARGAYGIHGLARKFKIMDDDRNGTLELYEFCKGLKESGITGITENAMKHLFHYFDKDDSGSITYNEFLVGVRGVMNERRRQLVHQVFRILDRDRSGEIELADIQGVYNASAHPDVIAERKTENEILQQFLETFEGGASYLKRTSTGTTSSNSSSNVKNTRYDGIVTLTEFEEYYQNISASVDNDDYFELMIRNAWHIAGGEGWCANTTNRRVLVTHNDGRQSVETITQDLGMKADDFGGLAKQLYAQGINDIQSLNVKGNVDDGKGGNHAKATVYVKDLPQYANNNNSNPMVPSLSLQQQGNYNNNNNVTMSSGRNNNNSSRSNSNNSNVMQSNVQQNSSLRVGIPTSYNVHQNSSSNLMQCQQQQYQQQGMNSGRSIGSAGSIGGNRTGFGAPGGRPLQAYANNDKNVNTNNHNNTRPISLAQSIIR